MDVLPSAMTVTVPVVIVLFSIVTFPTITSLISGNE